MDPCLDDASISAVCVLDTCCTGSSTRMRWMSSSACISVLHVHHAMLSCISMNRFKCLHPWLGSALFTVQGRMLADACLHRHAHTHTVEERSLARSHCVLAGLFQLKARHGEHGYMYARTHTSACTHISMEDASILTFNASRAGLSFACSTNKGKRGTDHRLKAP